MALETGVLMLVLLAAFLHASWNALVKAGGDRLVMTTLVMVGPAPLSIAALFVLPPLLPEAIPFLIASTLIHYVYYGLMISAYRHGDLSQVYPVSRGAAPALVAMAAWAVAGEPLTTGELVGVFVVSIGIMSLAWRGRAVPWRDGEAQAIGFAMLNGLAIASYLIVDGLGVRSAGNAITYICWLFVLEALPLLGFTLWRRRGRIRAAFRPHLRNGLAGGMIAGISYGITLWALSLGPMAHIVALRETSVLMGAALGALVLKERFGQRRIASAGLVATGAVLLNLGF